MGATRTKRRKSTVAKYSSWNKIAVGAQAKASRALRENASKDEIVRAVKQYAAEIERIPPAVRAMETATQDCERLVEILAAAGVRFASRKNAPAQLAASTYAGWLVCHESRNTKSVDWLAVVGLLIAGIEHALTNKTGVPEVARELFDGR